MAFLSTLKVHVSSLETTLAALRDHCIRVDEVQVAPGSNDAVIVYNLWADEEDPAPLINLIINGVPYGDDTTFTQPLEVPTVADMQVMDDDTEFYTEAA